MKTQFILLLVVSTLLTGTSPATETNPPVTGRVINADVRQVQGPLNTMFKRCIGAGRANEDLRADWQRQLIYAHQECGFEYIRMHGLLSDDMGVYREDKAGRPEYNWQYIDELYDFLNRIGMKPFVELGFMPSALGRGSKSVFWWRGNVTQPKDYQKWGDLIRTLVTHFKERYGDGEVRTWYFEVWNELNLRAFFDGTQTDYFKLYAVTAQAIKDVSPAYKVGEPATAGCAWVPEFIQLCATNHSPVGFISTHAYGISTGFVDPDGTARTILLPDTNEVTMRVFQMREQIAKSALPNLELHITEWSASWTPTDPIHDTYHSAAFILNKLKSSGDAAQSMSYWVFTDILEEAGPHWTPFHGGFGLINYQDINKPTFYAFQFLNRLGGTELNSSDPASWICTDRCGGIQALLWNFTILDPGASVYDQVFYKRDLPSVLKNKVTLNLTNIPKGKYRLEVYKVGYRVNDAYATYMDLGSPSQLTKAQVAKIRSENSGVPIATSTVTVGEDGKFQQRFDLRENDV
jgi:xylan 1,4-beta-xylosidase